MSKMITTLQQLQQLRQRAVEDLSQQLASQQQRCQRYEKNISALTSLSNSALQIAPHAALMANQSGYRRTIQRVIDWQKQEQALAAVEAQKLQQSLLHEARSEMCLKMTLDARKSARQQEQERRERKLTDDMAAQCWQRHKT